MGDPAQGRGSRSPVARQSASAAAAPQHL